MLAADGVNNFDIGISYLGLQRPDPDGPAVLTVNGLTISNLKSSPSSNKQRKHQTQPAAGSATVWPTLQHEVFEPLRFEKSYAHKVKSKLPALVASCTQLCMLGISLTTHVHLTACTA